jgi:hypothetical protein
VRKGAKRSNKKTRRRIQFLLRDFIEFIVYEKKDPQAT